MILNHLRSGVRISIAMKFLPEISAPHFCHFCRAPRHMFAVDICFTRIDKDALALLASIKSLVCLEIWLVLSYAGNFREWSTGKLSIIIPFPSIPYVTFSTSKKCGPGKQKKRHELQESPTSFSLQIRSSAWRATKKARHFAHRKCRTFGRYGWGQIFKGTVNNWKCCTGRTPSL